MCVSMSYLSCTTCFLPSSILPWVVKRATHYEIASGCTLYDKTALCDIHFNYVDIALYHIHFSYTFVSQLQVHCKA